MNRAIVSLTFLGILIAGACGSTPALADKGDCGQPQSTGSGPKTADALAALKKAVGTASACDGEPCVCDVNGNGAISTTDALLILKTAVGQHVDLACDCACATLGGAAATATTVEPPAGAALDLPSAQIQLDVRFIGIDRDSFDDLGLAFGQIADLALDDGPGPGGTSGANVDLAVSSNASGGPSDLAYFLYAHHRNEGALPVLNENFVSPFTGVKTFFLLPTKGCVLFDPSATSVPQKFPGGEPVENVAADDAGYGADKLLYELSDDDGVLDLVTLVKGDSRNTFAFAPRVTMYPGQAVMHMIDDVEPAIQQVREDFRMRIQDVTPSPFGVFTGAVIDLTPRLGENGNVEMQIRVGTQMASFFLSKAFSVDSTPVDAEIPLHRRSRDVTTITVPAGRTLVLGGLLRDGQQEPEHGLPLLGDLPVTGMLAHKQTDPSRQNLILLVKPTIVEPD